ncbi:MAG: NAD(P)-dependent oxidoreductase [Methylococcaceae bacterium]
MKIAVTGATGFVGQNLCRHLDQQGHTVIPLARSVAQLPAEFSHLSAKDADVTSLDSLKSALEGVDVCINLAALFNHPDKSFDEYRAVNVQGVSNVLIAAQSVGVKRVIHCSTVGIAAGGSMPYSEDSPYCPPEWDKYETTKCDGEKAALAFYETEKYPLVIIRPAQVYGPGDVSKIKFYKMVKKGVIVNPGNTFKHLIYIDDLCRSFEAALTNDDVIGKAIIIAGKEPTPLKELIQIVATQLGVKTPGIVIPAIPMTLFATVVEWAFGLIDKKPPIFRRSMDFFTKSVRFKTNRMENELKFEPTVSAEEGVKQTAEWYRKEGLI